MTNIKKYIAMILAAALLALTLVSCDMSMISDLLEDIDEEDLDNEESTEAEIDSENDREETTTKRSWSDIFGGGSKDTEVVEDLTIEFGSSEIYYPEMEEWPEVAEGEFEYTLEYNEYKEAYYVLSNVGSWRGKHLEIPSEYNGIPVKKIGYSAFMDARMETVVISEGIEEIEMWAFGYCEALREVYLPSTLTYISERVFTYSNNIEILQSNGGKEHAYFTVHSCIIDANNRTLHTVTNNNAWAIQEIIECYDIRAIGADACRGITNLDYIMIPDNIEEIGHYAFYGCSNLGYVDFGNSENSKLSYIGTSAFSYCSTLSGMYMPMGNPTYYAMGDCIIERATGRVVLGCSNSYIPDDGSITAIGGFAFEGCRRLSHIEIPASVKVIEIAAFEGCSKLRSVILHEGLETIEQRAFCHNNNLKEITVPSTVTFIGDEAFRGVPALDESYEEPEYNYGTIITPEGGLGNIVISPDSNIVSITMNADGSYTIVYADGTVSNIYVGNSGSSEGGFSGSYEDIYDGNFEFSTIVGGNGFIGYQPIP